MKVVLIYRKRYNEAHSIEELFHNLAYEMSKHIEIIEFQAGSRFKILSDLWCLWQLKADIYHITGSVNYFSILLPHKKTVVTIHDLSHYLKNLKGFKKWLYKWLWMILPIKCAQVVTSVSQSTADDIYNYLGLKYKKIEIIPNCYNSIMKPEPQSLLKDCPKIFQIGTAAHKNVSRVIQAISGLPCKLILVGKLSDKLKHELQQYNIKYESYFHISFEEVHRLYIESDIVTFVSLKEGFGVPIIEAQAVGRPVITSNYDPMSIVAGDGACLVDPLSVENIRRGILRVINDEEYRNGLVEAGFKNVAKYSIEAVCNKYLSVYKQNISP